uniref:NADH-ubiquinone oxidoreductase chain 5 n=1 Tax=Euphyllodromia sp. Z257 TaxID=2093493 RepID=A0A2P1H9Z0_9NEOP|nr:NADH dehydrogenase subunit 5 [Euphyllodromia sp. Z257]
MTLLIFSLIMLMLSFYFILNDFIYFVEWEIINLNSNSILMTFLFDWMSLIFMGFVFFISSLVILYSGDYMKGDLNMNRFIMLVLMFVLSMMFLILSPNMISILLGWDGLGLVSYCLVIYYQNLKSYNAGMITALTNRVGDVLLLIIISWMLNFGDWNYFLMLDFYEFNFDMKLIGFLIILSAMTKSAQIPFSSWLPAAMAAPTPVSALVHSSTLVTAGVYLIIRFSFVFNDFLNSFLLIFSGLTMFMAGLGANFEYDLKKIIALSTLSQLGLMVSVLSLGFIKLAFFHLLMHALLKALLFMCAGVFIHFCKDCQDIRYLGNLTYQMPMTCSFMMVSNFALCGMPFLAGFYSKDLILESVSFHYLNMFGFYLFYISTGLTVCYTFRLFYFMMCGDINLNSFFYMNENSKNMFYSMSLLLTMVIIGGSFFSWIIFSSPVIIYLPLNMKLLVILVSLIGGLIGYSFSVMKLNIFLFSLKFNYFSGFLGSMWFMPYIFSYGLSYYPLMMGYKTFRVFDLGWNEYFGSQGLYYVLMFFSKLNQLFQYNNLSVFMMFFIMWFLLLLLLLLV